MAIWLNSLEVSTLLDCTIRTVQNRIASGLYKSKTVSHAGYSGKKILIDLESLPLSAQEKYYGLEEQKRQDEILSLTKSQREKADFKLQTVDFYRQAKAEGMTLEEFLTDYNARYECRVTRPQLLRWQNQYKTGGYMGLVDNRGTHNKGTSSIPEEAWNYFCSLYLQQQKRGVKLCYDLTKKVYPDIPTVETFRNQVNKIPYNTLVYYREGEKAFNDKCLPYVIRTREDLQSNSIWCSDHHRCDFFIKSPYKKEPCRPWLTAFTDIKSGKIISYIFRVEAPNADVVKKALGNGIEKYGIPEKVYFDNGKDYKEKSFDKDFSFSIINQLGIEVIYAQPYHGQSKPIERFFRTFEERFGKLFDTYAGRNAKERPEQMNVKNELIYKKAPTLEEAAKQLALFIDEFNNTPSNACEMYGQTPNEVYSSNLVSKKVLRNKATLQFLCGDFTTRIVNRGYIRFEHRDYYHEKLIPFNKQKIYVNYAADNMDQLNIFDLEQKAICIAETNVKTPFGAVTKEVTREGKHRHRIAKKEALRSIPVCEADLMNTISGIQLERKLAAEPDQAPDREVVKIIPALDKEIDKLSKQAEESENPMMESIRQFNRIHG